jgi:hypothetical protein
MARTSDAPPIKTEITKPISAIGDNDVAVAPVVESANNPTSNPAAKAVAIIPSCMYVIDFGVVLIR